ncbi:hypothetical protein EJ06DRAFT_525444 [Trichodelitschia bisporula]|uniref:Uncharacterized protein n=1 Tax=Trichodelitschia bisporula TaxID=703511 RepID=A0A6G1I997_9PEZI|nr:hypothetical protein EJ06DRAFT_525444 [Trichodelitschia bisporula]
MMAQRFSAQLDDVFKIDNGLDNLVQTVERKYVAGLLVFSSQLLTPQAPIRLHPIARAPRAASSPSRY